MSKQWGVLNFFNWRCSSSTSMLLTTLFTGTWLLNSYDFWQCLMLFFEPLEYRIAYVTVDDQPIAERTS